MARSVILSNGSLAVGLNEQGLVHDFYYPFVGLENLTNARSIPHKIGVWVDKEFAWVDESWQVNADFDTDALISNITLTNNNLLIELHLRDFVDFAHNAFIRTIQVKNLADHHREVRLFMHQAFIISRSGRSDTALYVPEEHYLLDYKGRCCLLINGQIESGNSFDQFAVGNFGIDGKKGTYVDAEDGELSGSAVEHGGVDSVIRFNLSIPSQGEATVNYWVAAAETQQDAEKLNNLIKEKTAKNRLAATRRHWHEWFATGSNRLHQVSRSYLPMVKKSMMVIKAHMDKHGGIIASCDSSIYNYGKDYYSYVWPRDGAYAIWPLIRLGYQKEARQFFNFCRDILHKDGYLQHKYQPDKAIGSTWHPLLHNNNRSELAIQEDETAIVVYMLGEYLQYSNDSDFVSSMYDDFIAPAADFMARFIDEETGLPHASYDLWEEKFLTNTYTVAITYQALLTAAEFAQQYGSSDQAERWQSVAERILQSSRQLYDDDRDAFIKGYLMVNGEEKKIDSTLDISSLYGVTMFGLFEDARHVHGTLQLVEDVLLDASPVGGCPRYEHDNYFASSPQYMGNPWFVTTLWLAQYYARANNHDKAHELIDWTISKAQPSGVLSEQVNPSDGSPISVTPLVWSHAELINTVLDISRQ